MILVAGVGVPRSALTMLAVTMRDGRDRSLAYRIGEAIDRNWPDFPLFEGDRERLLSAIATFILLEAPHPALEELRNALLAPQLGCVSGPRAARASAARRTSSSPT